jgi:hypothetical protein
VRSAVTPRLNECRNNGRAEARRSQDIARLFDVVLLLGFSRMRAWRLRDFNKSTRKAVSTGELLQEYRIYKKLGAPRVP